VKAILLQGAPGTEADSDVAVPYAGRHVCRKTRSAREPAVLLLLPAPGGQAVRAVRDRVEA